MRRRILSVLAVLLMMVTLLPAASARHKEKETSALQKIIYVPHDNRPISDKQTTEVAQKLGIEVVVPPDKILGDRQNLGNPEELWRWLEDNLDDADAAVISSDSMLYGSLVGSRKHNCSEAELLIRTERFRKLHQAYPKLPLYVFGSIMRTPKSGEASGREEPDYYRSYGSDIFRYTVLKDREELTGLTRREKKEAAFLQELIPSADLKDWLGRRKKNYSVNEKLIRMAREDTFNYLILGRDDNAPYSQTHKESRHLMEESQDLDNARFQIMAGIDEMGMLLISRAVNIAHQKMPSVYVKYNWGRGANTIPAYSDEKISDSIRSAVTAAYGTLTTDSSQADLVLMVNTDNQGKTYEANDPSNDSDSARHSSVYFADLVKEYVEKGYPVGIADIIYANGADNALMEELKKRDLLFRIRAYAGWNTATNSTGFVIGAGVLTKYMKAEDTEELLLTRYLDDWVYQSNVRNTVQRQLSWLRGEGYYGSLDEKRKAVGIRTSQLISRFAEKNLPSFKSLEEIQVTFPWNRMFEADIARSAYKEVHFFRNSSEPVKADKKKRKKKASLR